MIGNALRRVRRSSAAIALSMSVMPVAIAAAETADEFVARLNRELAATALELNAAAWTQATYITVDTQFLTAKANERLLADFSRLVAESKAFDGKPMSPASRRTIELLKLGLPAPAPDDPAKRAELAAILAGMEAKYGSAKYCPKGSDGCRDETELKAVIAASRNYDELLDAWQGWHDAARPLRADYARFVTLANEGARELGYKDLGAMWRAGYDMPADDFTKEAAHCGRCSLSTSSCTATRGRGSRRNTAKTGSPRASRSRHTCSATCGRRSGTLPTTCSNRTPASTTSTWTRH